MQFLADERRAGASAETGENRIVSGDSDNNQL
jgi:hypothetical protein